MSAALAGFASGAIAQETDMTAAAGPYLVIIRIAEPGTPLLNPVSGDWTGKTSSSEHMWYSIQVGDGPVQSYGCRDGKVTRLDNQTYYKPRYTRTMEIIQEQYNKLREFGERGISGQWDGLDSTSNGVNNCYEVFAWGALRYAGFEVGQ